MTQNVDKRLIAKNTIALYLRMLITIIVGLYTSRVVLATLGVEDYGIYGIAGSVIAMLGFLNGSLRAATSRFITYDLGRNNKEILSRTFCIAVIVHAAIALVILLIAETIGLWFFCNKLVIPEGRMNAALVVYQISIISAFVSIVQSPYNALIIAHERMNFYAYVEILSAVLKLLIVYLLCIVQFDKLILYTLLGLAVHFLIFFIYVGYNVSHFEESKLKWQWDWSIARPIISFTGWDLYGGFCVTARQQGMNFILNMFFGVIVNAACSVATTVYGIITGLAYNVFSAMSPQIIKQYAERNFKAMEDVMSMSIRYSVVLFMAISVPAIFEMDFLMTSWLGNVPQFAVAFCQISLIANVLGLCNSNFNNAIHATGNVKWLSAVTGTLFLLAVPISYCILRFFTSSPVIAYSANAFMMLPIIIADVILVKKQIPQLSQTRLVKDIINTWLVCAFPAILIFFLSSTLDMGLMRFFITTMSYLLLESLLVIQFVLTDNERYFLYNKLRKLLKK